MCVVQCSVLPIYNSIINACFQKDPDDWLQTAEFKDALEAMSAIDAKSPLILVLQALLKKQENPR